MDVQSMGHYEGIHPKIEVKHGKVAKTTKLASNPYAFFAILILGSEYES